MSCLGPAQEFQGEIEALNGHREDAMFPVRWHFVEDGEGAWTHYLCRRSSGFSSTAAPFSIHYFASNSVSPDLAATDLISGHCMYCA